MKFQLSMMITVFSIITQSTSKYHGVSWNEKRNLWQAEFDINGKKKKAYFDNEFYAAKHLNKLCEKMGMPLQNPTICKTPNQQKNEKTSQYKGVNWCKEIGKWCAQVHIKKGRPKPGGYFYDELDAAKRVNQLCEQLEIPALNPTINAIPNEKYQAKEKTSQYKGVHWHKENKKWVVKLYFNGQAQTYGGTFNEELDAAKKVNQLCIELGITEKNPGINGIPNQQCHKKEKTSQYKGVCWIRESRKWYARFHLNGQIAKYGGQFNDEVNAAKRVNQLCKNLGIPQQNPTVDGIPTEQYQKKGKTSQYKGVCWNKEKWYVQLRVKGEKQKFGGTFKDELEAAKRVNQLCEELGIPLQNPTISGTPNHQYQKREKTSQYKGVCWQKKRKTWRCWLHVKEGKSKFGGNFKEELDAAKRINQLCEELGIPPQNPGVIEMTTLHDDFQTIENPVISVKILNTDNDDANKMKRKRKKELNDDDKLPVDRNYFYDYMLK